METDTADMTELVSSTGMCGAEVAVVDVPKHPWLVVSSCSWSA